MADSLASASTERAVRALRARALAWLLGLAGLALLSYFVGIKGAGADLDTAAAIDVGVRIRTLTQGAALLSDARAMGDAWLSAFHAAVAQHRDASETGVARQRSVHGWVLVLALLVLLASSVMLLGRMLRSGRTDRDALAEASAKVRELEAENVERRAAEAALRESEERFRQIAENVSGILWIFDAVTGRTIYVNRAYEKIFQKSCAGAYESPGVWLDAVHPEDRSRVADEVTGARRTGGLDHEFRIVRPDGSIRWIRTRVFPIRDAAGSLYRLAGISDDITEQKMIQNQIAQSQKLETIGQLAAGIAHEINTPTQYVADNIRFLRDGFDELDRLLLRSERLFREARQGPVLPEALDKLEESVRDVDVGYLREEIPKAIEQSLEGIARITKIVRAMKDFSHPGLQERLPVDINQAIETTLTVAQNELKYVADVVTRFDRDIPSVPCYPNEINQVVLNILINAADAIADAVGRDSGKRGTISISTARVDSWAEIRIGDTGSGIPEKIRGRIFDPFFTTKDVGKGTGQGLALSHAIIVEKHQGSITFESEVDRGTIFIIRLPLQPGR